MAANSAISWTTHTFNPWRGCVKVAAGCANCYAESMSKRNPKTLGIWGNDGTRVIASESMWKEPVKWNKAARKDRGCELCYGTGMYRGGPGGVCEYCRGADKTRPQVFCASLADVFEDWNGAILDSQGVRVDWCEACAAIAEYRGLNDHCGHGWRPMVLDDARERLFRLINATPNLDWQLLTKRPENIRRMLVPHSLETVPGHVSQNEGDGKRIVIRSNMWLGTSIAEQKDADNNIPHLLKCGDIAPILFLSMEPLIGPVDLRYSLSQALGRSWPPSSDGFVSNDSDGPIHEADLLSWIDWVIVGAESGHGRRPMNLDWARSIRDQCAASGTAFFVKQLEINGKVTDDINDFPADLRIQQFPVTN